MLGQRAPGRDPGRRRPGAGRSRRAPVSGWPGRRPGSASRPAPAARAAGPDGDHQRLHCVTEVLGWVVVGEDPDRATVRGPEAARHVGELVVGQPREGDAPAAASPSAGGRGRGSRPRRRTGRRRRCLRCRARRPAPSGTSDRAGRPRPPGRPRRSRGAARSGSRRAWRRPRRGCRAAGRRWHRPAGPPGPCGHRTRRRRRGRRRSGLTLVSSSIVRPTDSSSLKAGTTASTRGYGRGVCGHDRHPRSARSRPADSPKPRPPRRASLAAAAG